MCVCGGGCLDTKSCLLPVDHLFLKGSVFLRLEQSQALCLIGRDESEMALKNLPFHTNHFNQK